MKRRRWRSAARNLVRWSLAGCFVLAAVSCSSSAPTASAPQAAPPRPEAIAGDWMLETRTGDRAVEGRLHFSVVKGVLAGSVYDADGNAREMKNLALKGTKISWDVGNQHYAGTAGGIAMKGTARRVAREPEGEESAGPLPGHIGGGGYAGGRFGGGGRRGRDRRGDSGPEITWSAYKSSAPSPVSTATPQR